MVKKFNYSIIRTLYAPRFEYITKDQQGRTQHYTGLHFPTEPKARDAAEDIMTYFPGQFSGYIEELLWHSEECSALISWTPTFF